MRAYTTAAVLLSLTLVLVGCGGSSAHVGAQSSTRESGPPAPPPAPPITFHARVEGCPAAVIQISQGSCPPGTVMTFRIDLPPGYAIVGPDGNLPGPIVYLDAVAEGDVVFIAVTAG